ncbi:MAG TPA: O-antigen ligase family protein [Gammaproteobacteria bacterium]|nr:O-antigen ligase family protein [Gammaproteobacteria bacterium]
MSASVSLPAKIGAALVVLAFALLSTEHLVHYALALLMLGGAVACARAPHALWRDADLRRCSLAFLALWLPMLASLPDAVNPAHASKTALAYLHFWPAVLAIVIALRHAGLRRLVFAGVAAVIAFWLADAVLQLLTGRDLFGHPTAGKMLTGAFYPKQRLGLVLAVATPLYCLATAALARRWPLAWLLLLPLFLVILLSLKRTAWIMLAVSLAGLLWLACARRGGEPCRAMLALLLVLVFAIGGAIALDPALRARVAETAGLASGDFATMDRASSYRLTLWRTGWRMFEAHPLNGIGPRGYRHAYADYAPSEDFWFERGGGQTHPHLMLLEVALETGLIGLIGYACFLWLVLARLRQAADDRQAAWAISALAAAFPFNAHLAFYGSYWSSLAWLAAAVAMAGERQPRP